MSRRDNQGRDSDEAVDAGVRAWLREEEGAVTEHPAPEELVDYQEDKLAAPDVARIQEHLLVCAACREELFELHDFDGEIPADSALYPSEEMTEGSWQRFEAARAALRAASGAGEGEKRVVADQPRGWSPRARWWAIAASIALATVAGALVAAALLGRIEPRGRLAVGSPFVFDLDPIGASVLREATVPEVVVPRGMDPIVVRLNLGDLTAHAGYEAEVSDSGGRLVLRREELARDRSGSVTFMATRQEWSAGVYRVRLIALDADQPRELAVYAVRLRYET